ncbi:nucleoside diphosphate-linked moiety X motif 19 [Osmerus eperlanus]|uniref:nucleoside diphosphate-linked moiety X motif 19 n=1 Tax=Osmerus eperlanus TaxID=29151 RepID=UPI002E10D2B1
MNTALKHWKEAATVIISAGTRHKLSDGLSRCLDKGTSTPTTGIEGLSNFPHESTFDYDVLLLKRSGKSGFMPNAYVFPGGLVEPSDFSSEWLDIFKAFRRSPNFGLGTVKQPPATRPPIFATDRMKLGSPIPGDVAFRICAVRETFEESGVLLAVPKEEENSLLKTIENTSSQNQTELTRVYKMCDKSELAKWRALVNKNPSNFIRMCRELECLPNIWALHEWGNWLTPSGVYEKQRRYDTAFFMCCLQETPDTLQDEKEIVHFKWSPPSEILHSFLGRKLWIAPPQFYDLSRMCRFPSLAHLHNFASRRASEGCEHWLPVRLVTDNVYISLLPGDSLYPEDGSGQIDMNKTTDATLQETEQGSSALHRIVCHDLHTAAVHISITPKYNHLLPFGNTSLRSDTNSQL